MFKIINSTGAPSPISHKFITLVLDHRLYLLNIGYILAEVDPNTDVQPRLDRHLNDVGCACCFLDPTTQVCTLLS